MIARPLLRWRFGHWVGVLTLVACEREPPPAPTPPRASSVSVQVGTPNLPQELAPKPRPAEPPSTQAAAGGTGSEAAPAPTAWSVPPTFPADYHGTWFWVTSLAAGVYVEPSFEARKIGYLRNGSRVPVATEPASKKNCSSGWFALASGGFVCGNLGTTNGASPDVKFAAATPNLDEVLPYTYARNAKNGTPLYRSVPSREQMEQYEPYLLEHSDSAKSETKRVSDSGDSARRSLDGATATATAASTGVSTSGTSAGASAVAVADVAAAMADGGLLTAAAAADPAPEKPWWQREDSKDRLHELKLEQLESDADGVLAKRMVSGFYVAVDKTFRWNSRRWYKTTKGLVAPSDRFWQTAGPKFKGVELNGDTWKLPVGWVYGGRKSIGGYLFDASGKNPKNEKSHDRFEPVALTGKTQEFGRTTYAELADGSWVKRSQIRITAPGPLPSGLAPGERWIDVNLKTQTLVAFVGDRPIYATLISSGKESKIKDKDHRTPTGEWRIREKHITTTMDGDGTAAGDLPYSIEDVPYVLYFHRAYALHGAFWHNNFGVQMSHGCVNLAPLDAKYLFFFAEPALPAGFHGVWASEAHPGTRVVIHE